MTFNQDNSHAFMVGTEDDRVEALKELLGYPVLQHDPEGSNFWYLRPGEDENKALETCPIAVGFYSELNKATDKEIRKLLTSQEKQQEIYGHYSEREFEQQPVMYLLLPGETQAGRVAMVLPEDEKRLRQRQIQTFAWDEEDLQARLARLQQKSLLRTNRKRIENKPLLSIPLVEWVFYPPAKTARQLAQQLAKFALQMEQAIKMMGNNLEGYLNELFQSFKRELLPELKPSLNDEKGYSFADIYAQTITYGLFTARVFSHIRNPELKFDIQNIWEKLPETNPFLKQLFQAVFENQKQIVQKQNSGDELTDTIGQIVLLLNAAKMDAILSDFKEKRNQEDIVIRFYEDFLAEYKPQMRERRGVYYTPEPVVSYMVRSVDILVKEKFNKPLGLADPEVEILEPACGTASFLLYIFRLIHERFHDIEYRELFKFKVGDISWSQYVENHLLTRIYGFELLMAPYAIAHLKISLFLEETGYKFDSGKRLEIILTNTLDEPKRKSEVLLKQYISEESDRAVAIKRDQPVMLVIGNPPYSYKSENTLDWITSLIRDYYQVNGNPLGERNPKGLQDDYVKFIRFAQWKIQKTGTGILAFITNNGFLDNPTFRGMRQSLLDSFDNFYIYDLHGSSKKKEKQADGSPDENVFDIQQGVSITIAAKGCQKFIFHSNLYGDRSLKYKKLLESDINSTQWKSVKPKTEYYLLVPQETELFLDYNQAWKITEVFSVNSTGIKTHRDHFAIDFDEDNLEKRIEKFRDIRITDDQISQIYSLSDTRDWNLHERRRALASILEWKKYLVKCLYRPFDTRAYYHHENVVELPRLEIMRHLLSGENMCLGLGRQGNAVNDPMWSLISTSCYPVDTNLFRRGGINIFPLYLYPNTDNSQKSVLQEQRRPNFSYHFLKAITEKLGYTPTPEAIFYYIYAIFHSPTYRTRYAEFLKIDFPRVPLTSNNELFHQLANYGEELVSLHLMKSPQLDNFITKFVKNNGNNVVDAAHPKYNQSAVIINKKGDKFTGVPEKVWNFYVGGYQVCQKWLKDRKGRTLSDEDIQHYQRIIVALKETIVIMEKIDEVIPHFPIT